VTDSFQRLEIEQIPAYVASKAVRYTGALVFRVGRADEPLRHGGLSHLVEHLALFGLGGSRPYAYNGRVTALYTIFIATGAPDEVGEFLSHVSRALQDLPLQRLNDEARVLKTEAVARPKTPPGEYLWLRYGATGLGQSILPELALITPEPSRIRSWVEERFTAGNAALWFSGPPPPNLRLELRAGPRHAAPEPTPVPDVSYPCCVYAGPGGMGLSFVRPRTEWLSVVFNIASERIAKRLRYDRGLTYDVGLDIDPITADTSHAALWAGCLPAHAPAVRDGILGGLDDLASAGATDEEMARTRQAFARTLEDPESAAQQAAQAATNELIGCPVFNAAELLRELDAVDGREIGRRTQAAMTSALLVLPPGCEAPEKGFEAYPLSSASVVDGRSFRAVDARFPWSKSARLIVGEDGVSLLGADEGVQTVQYPSCAAAIAHTDGALEIFGEDGFRILVQPAYWRGGGEAVRRLLEVIPADRIIHVPEDGLSP
jgi:hypothetical protein